MCIRSRASRGIWAKPHPKLTMALKLPALPQPNSRNPKLIQDRTSCSKRFKRRNRRNRTKVLMPVKAVVVIITQGRALTRTSPQTIISFCHIHRSQVWVRPTRKMLKKNLVISQKVLISAKSARVQSSGKSMILRLIEQLTTLCSMPNLMSVGPL